MSTTSPAPAPPPPSPPRCPRVSPSSLPMTAAARAELEAYMKDNPRGKHGRIIYDLRGDFGVDPGELRSRFDFYFERFAVRAETQSSEE